MNSLPMCLSVFLLCFAYFDQTFSKPVHQATVQEVDQEIKNLGIRKYDLYLSMELAAASSGKHLFKQPATLTEDCVRTAKVTMDLLTRPDTSRAAYQIMIWSSSKTFSDPTSSQNSLNSFCKNLNIEVKQNLFRLSDFEELKKKVVLPKPAKNFVDEIPQGVSALEFIQNSNTLISKHVPELDKYFAMNIFRLLGDKIEEATFKLSRRAALKSIVQSEFQRALDDYVKEQSNKTEFTDDDIFDVGFIHKVDEYFTKNSALNVEYKKLLISE